MSYKDSKFKVLDNTGVKKVRCLHVFKTKQAQPSSIVTVVVKNVLPKRKIKKGQICRAVIVRLKRKVLRYSGYSCMFDNNYVVLLKKTENVPLGTRVSGCVFYELRLNGFLKIVSLSSYLI